MRNVGLFKVACVLVALLWVAGGVVTVLHVWPGIEVSWQWQLLREPFTSGTIAAMIVGLVYWWCGAPGSKIWDTAYRAGVRDGVERGATAAGPNVIPLQQRRTSMS